MTVEQQVAALMDQVREQATVIARMGQDVHQHEQQLRPARSAPLLNRVQADKLYSPPAMRKQLGAGGAAPLDLSGLKGTAADIQPAAIPEVPQLPQLGDASVKQGTMLKAAGVTYRRGAQEWEPIAPQASQRGSAAELTAGGNPDSTRAAGLMPPAAHHLTHQNGGNDEVATAVPAANAIPKAGAGSTLDSAWIPAVAVAAAGAIPKGDGTGKLDISWIPTGVPTTAQDAFYSSRASSIAVQTVAALAAGRYLVAVSLGATVSGTGSLLWTFSWTSGGVLRTITSTALALTVAMTTSEYFAVYVVNVDAATNFTYATTYAATGSYEFSLTLTKL